MIVVPGPERLVTSDELAKILGVSRRTITRWATSGEIRPEVVTVGGAYRWDVEAVKAQLRERRQRDE